MMAGWPVLGEALLGGVIVFLLCVHVDGLGAGAVLGPKGTGTRLSGCKVSYNRLESSADISWKGGEGIANMIGLRLRGGKGTHPRMDPPPVISWNGEDGIKNMIGYEEVRAKLNGDDTGEEFDIQRGAIDLLGHNGGVKRWSIDPEEKEILKAQHAEMSEKVRMTQIFLLLQNLWFESQLPGGLNCTYAMTWKIGYLWEHARSTKEWTKAAWFQMQRAEKVEDMPPIWHHLTKKAWEEFQEFLAVLELPDGGISTEIYQSVVQRWNDLQAAYTSNVNDAFEIMMANNTLRKHIKEKTDYVEAVKDERMKVPHLWPFGYYLWKVGFNWWREKMGVATEQEKLEQYRTADVTIFGVTLFNTKDNWSDRMWSWALSQGETQYVIIWQMLSIMFKRMEWGVNPIIPIVPKDEPVFPHKHVLLNNTDYQKDYYAEVTKKTKKDRIVDKRRYNALHKLADYFKHNLGFMGFDDSSAWDTLKHKYEPEGLKHVEEEKEKYSPYEQWCWPVYFTPETEEKYLRDRCIELMLEPYFEKLDNEGISIRPDKIRLEEKDEGYDVLFDWLNGLLDSCKDPNILKDPKKGLHNATLYQGGGYIMACAKALGYDTNGGVKEWIDNPDVPKRVKQLCLIHPFTQKCIQDAQIWDPYKHPWCTIVDAEGNAVPNQDDYADFPFDANNPMHADPFGEA